MTQTLRDRLANHFVACCAVSLASVATSPPQAKAAIVYRSINQVVSATVDGLYVNVETGATYDFANANTAFPGWDINPFGSSGLSFFWSGTTNGASAGVRLNTVAGGTVSGSTIASLPAGFVISSALVGGSSGASFGTGSASFTTTNQGRWRFNDNNYFGFRFTNAANQVRYGYGLMQVGASATIRTLLSVAYEDSGGAITIPGGVTPNPVPGPLPILGATAAFSWSRRLRRRLQAKPSAPS